MGASPWRCRIQHWQRLTLDSVITCCCESTRYTLSSVILNKVQSLLVLKGLSPRLHFGKTSEALSSCMPCATLTKKFFIQLAIFLWFFKDDIYSFSMILKKKRIGLTNLLLWKIVLTAVFHVTTMQVFSSQIQCYILIHNSNKDNFEHNFSLPFHTVNTFLVWYL